LAIVYRALTLDALMRALRGTVAISAMILFIILGATTFAQILSFSGASDGIVSSVVGQGLSPFAVLLGMMAILIFLGIFVDQVSTMLITLPLFMPLVARLGIDPVWFGVLFLICMQLGLLLPPHGLLLMTMKGVAPPEVTMLHIFQAVTPYVLMSLALLGLILAVPAIATWLPALIG
jgi:TRAP-type C4-dicarboxylate transport system permease large subunit